MSLDGFIKIPYSGDAIMKMLEIVRRHAKRFMNGGHESVKAVSRRCGLKEEDATLWFKDVKVVCEPIVDAHVLSRTVEALAAARVIHMHEPLRLKNLVGTHTELRPLISKL